ncbi:MAG: hypothetical protein ACI4A3_03390 [Lachnospiraceae bacterium]
MKGFMKITKATAGFYLSVLLIVFAFVICDTMFICKDNGMAFTKQSLETEIRTDIGKQMAEKTFSIPQTGKDLCAGMVDKGENYSLLGFFTTMLGICLLLFVREFCFADRGAREFERTLPVKNTAIVLHEYLSILGILLLAMLLQTGLLLCCQNHYNHILARVLEERCGVVVSESFFSLPSEKLITAILCYTLFLVMIYTWIYLGMTIARNPLVGGVLSLVTWDGLYYIADTWGWTFWCQIFKKSITDEYELNVLVDKLDQLLYKLLSPCEFFRELELTGLMTGTVAGWELWKITGIIGIVLLFLMILIVFAAKKRELSKGRILYFRSADYLFALFCGLLCLSFEVQYVWDCSLWSAIIPSVVAAIAVCAVMRPFTLKKKENWRVEEGYSFFEKIKKKIGSEDVKRLFRFEWKTDLFFLVANCIWLFAGYNVHLSYMFSGINYAADEGAEMLFLELYTDLDYVAWDMIYIFLGKLILCQMVWLLIRKVFRYWIEKDSYGREFLGGLPVKRTVRYWFRFVMDSILMVLPVILYAFYVHKKTIWQLNAMEVDVPWFAASVAGLTVTCIAFLFLLLGFLYFMETMFPNGLMKLVGALGSFEMLGLILNQTFAAAGNNILVQFLYGFFTLKLPGNNYYRVADSVGSFEEVSEEFVHGVMKVPICYQGGILEESIPEYYKTYLSEGILSRFYDFSHVETYIGYALAYLAIAAILIGLALWLTKQLELSKQGFYFSFEKYLFSALISATFFAMLMANVVSWWHKCMIFLLIILLFVFLVLCMTPGRKIRFPKKTTA